MDTLLPILVAATVATIGWAVFQALVSPARKEKRKLQLRLSTETRPDNAVRTLKPLTLAAEVTGLPELLARRRFIQSVQRKLGQAYPEVTAKRFLILCTCLALLPMGIVWLISDNPVMAVGCGAAGGYLPFFFLNAKRSRRQRQIELQLPEALDFLGRILRAGQSFSTGLQMMSEELPNPLSGEFRRTYDQHSLGQSLEDALRDMAVRIDSTDFSFFVTAVIIQRQAGGDLSEVLKNIGNMVRSRLRLQQSVRAKTSEGRFTGYIMVAFPAVMFGLASMLNPDYSGILLHTPNGHILLGVAVTLQMIGLFLIRKITTVRV
jgi:tight adherence protein B